MKMRRWSSRIVFAVLLLLLAAVVADRASAQITITITNSPPFGTEGISYSFQFQASGGTSPYTYTCQSPCGVPSGLTLNPSGLLNGIPTTSGTFPFFVVASDSSNPPNTSVPVPKSIQIGLPPLDINTTSVPNATRGVAYNAPLSASGGSGGYSWSSASGTNLPSGLSVVATGAISGTPSLSATAGVYTFTVEAKDSSGDLAFQQLTLTLDNPAMALTGSLPPGIVGTPYPSGSGVSASGGNGGPYTYSWSGTTPPGLSLNASTGAVTGTPTSSGPFRFTVSVSDGTPLFTPAFTPQGYSITVYSAITLSPTSIPAADAQSNYLQPQTFKASGGSGSGYTYSISTAPPGMSFSPAGTLSGPPSSNGSFSFTITARDSLGLTGTSPTITLTVNPALTLSPTSLSPGQVGTAYPQVNFSASGGSGVYTLTSGVNVPGLTFNAGTLSGSPTKAGTYPFTVTAKDSLGYTATNNYTLSIANPPITVGPASIPPGQVGVSYSQVFTALGGNGGPYTFSISPQSPPFGLTFTASTATLSGSPTSFGTSNVTITAGDGTLTGQISYSLTIAPATLTLSPSSIPNGTVGTFYSQTFTAGGGLGTYTFSIIGTQPPGLNLTSSGATATLSGTPTTGGAYTFTVQVTDGTNKASQNPTVTVTNLPITLTPVSLPAGIVNGVYPQQTFTASGGNGGPYTYTMTGSVPGLGLTGAVLSGTPTTANTYNFTIGVSDGSQFTPAFTPKGYSITVYPAINVTPTTIPAADPMVNYSQPFGASGGSGSGYTYTISALPPGLTLNASTGVLSGPPSASGPFPFTITAHDSLGFTGTSPTITLTVNPALTLSPTTLAAGQVGTGYSQAFTASGGSGSYTYSLVGSAPGGLSLTSSVLSGTPTASGTFNFSITAKDSLGGTATNAYTLSIANPPVVVQPLSLPTGQVGVSYSQAFTASGGNGGPYTFSIGAAAPFGLGFTPSTATLSGTPTSSGSASITISATDGTLTGQRAYTLTVVSTGLTLSPSTLANGIVGKAYSQSFTASGGLGTYTFTLSPSTPPAGLTFVASGATATLSGIPTASGSFPLSVQVTDGSSKLANNYTLSVNPALSVLTTSLPGGAVNTGYSTTLSASGGAPPYTWSLSSGNGLPSGLTLLASGVVTGVPAANGTFSFGVTVIDSTGVSANASLSLVIQPAPLQFTTTSPLPPAVSGANYSVTFGATGGVPPYTFSLSSAPPTGLALNGAVLSGILTIAGSTPVPYNIPVQLSDSAGGKAGATFQVTVQPAAGGLILSAASLAFTAVSGGPTLPPQYVSVSSTNLASLTFSAGSDSPWLSASPSGNNLSTPATLQINVNQTGLQAGTQSGNIDITGPDGMHTVSVTLTVTALPPMLSVAPTLVSFSTDGTSQPGPGSIQVSNAGSGTLTFSASVLNGSSWVSLGSSPTAVNAGTPVTIPVNAVITGLGTGAYYDVIQINSSAGTANVPVTLLVAGASTINVVPTGNLFSSRAGQGESDGAQSFQVITTGSSSITWNASLTGGSGWVTLNTASGTSSPNNPGVVSYAVAPSNLSAGNYYAQIQISASGATNSPVTFIVVATVAPASSPAVPDPSPAGLLFVASPGSPVPPAQTVQVNTSSTSQVNFSAAANTSGGGNWLTVSPQNGATSTGSPGQVNVTANATGLATGVYQGGVGFTLQGNATAVRTVNVVLIVTGSAQTPSLVSTSSPAPQISVTPQSTCAPSKLVALETGLVSNFSTPAGWPTPLAIQLVDDCANPVSNASVVASFSNGDAPLALQLSSSQNAVYSATWNPHGTSSQVTVTARATAPSLQSATAQIVGAILPNQVPILYPHGTIHNMNPQAGAPLAPGTIVQIYGSGLSPAALQTGLPLPTNVNNTIVLIGGIAAPLYYVSDGQINAELPLELAAGKQYQILISANGALTIPDTLNIVAVTPGVAAMTNGTIIAQHADGSYVTATAPAQPGEILTIYLAGMGLTDVAITTGEVSPSSPLAHPLVQPTVTVNGESAQINFAGLTPQAVGLYQVNFTVPADAPAGNLTVVVSQGNALSNSGTIAVQ